MNIKSSTYWLLAATLVVIPAAPSGALVAVSEREQPVLWETPESGRGLGVPYHHAIREALLTAAYEAGVAICSQNGLACNDPAFPSICGEGFTKGNKEQQLVWSADFDDAADREIVILSLSLSVNNEKKSNRWQRDHLPRSKILVMQANVKTPPDATEVSRKELVARRLYGLIADSSEIRAWFAGLRQYSHLLRERPQGEFGEPIASRFAQEPPSSHETDAKDAAEAQSWEDKEDAVADLLIEGANETARERATALLAKEGLPDHVRVRVERFLAIAEERLAARDGKAQPGAEATPEPVDVSFEVRVPKPGSGFREGFDGRLRISARGIDFTPSGARAGAWAVSWSSLEKADRADGLWDVSSPLVIRTRDGERHFLVERKPGGTFGDGQVILNHIEKGQRAR